jgi:hypothetical protein
LSRRRQASVPFLVEGLVAEAFGLLTADHRAVNGADGLRAITGSSHAHASSDARTRVRIAAADSSKRASATSFTEAGSLRSKR